MVSTTLNVALSAESLVRSAVTVFTPVGGAGGPDNTKGAGVTVSLVTGHATRSQISRDDCLSGTPGTPFARGAHLLYAIGGSTELGKVRMTAGSGAADIGISGRVTQPLG